MIWLLAGAGALAAIAAGLRWLRIAQREHYLAPAATRFSLRWWCSGPYNPLLLLMAVAGVAGTLVDSRLGLLTALSQVGPIGLSIRGRTSPLSWTARLRRVAALVAILVLALLAVGLVLDMPLVMVLPVLLLPVLVDLCLVLLAPLERKLGDRWVKKASRRLKDSGARVVAITGSYGKTTTKQYVRHLLSKSARTVASPASFNNRMGLARAINDHLVPGTEVFVAEMGTYGPGEIADLCRWIEPTIAAIVSIGPVHLERFRSEERIVAAKSEIFERAGKGVISVDHPLLEALAREHRSHLDLTTVSVSGKPSDVQYEEGSIRSRGVALGPVPESVFPANLAVAVGIVEALGYEVDGGLFDSLPDSEHRQSVTVSPSGVTVIDDTFNSNPAGATRALAILEQQGGRKVLVTPGMVELGPLQESENEAFANAAATICDEVIIVGSTNRKALLRGTSKGPASVTVVPTRDAAVAVVRDRLGAGDAVLYENDLPDHYP
ncbi:MAG: Mur ligase family protein [Acidimicrobiia bacterium]